MIRKNIKGVIVATVAAMLLFSFTRVSAGIPIGHWRSHYAYSDATKSLKAFGQIFVLSDGSIYSYDPIDEAIYTYDKTGGLNGTEIVTMDYCKAENCILLVYSDGNMDILYENGKLYNFTDFQKSSTIDKTVYQVKIIGDKAYISSAAGLIIFNIHKLEISNTYKFDSAVLSFTFDGDSVFCATESNGIMLGNINDNLLDKNNWKQFHYQKFTDLFTFGPDLLCRSYDKRVWRINRQKATLHNIMDHVDNLCIEDDRFLLVQDSIINVFFSPDSFITYKFENININHALYDNNDIWLSCGVNGLCKFTVSDDNLICKGYNIKPNGPRRNWIHSIVWPDNETMLAIGGCQNYSGIDYPGTVMIMQNGLWKYAQENLEPITGHKYINLTEAAVDPDDENHFFVGSARQGLYEFKNSTFHKLHTWDNSGLTNILDHHKYDYVSVSSLQYDSKGNLWMTNNEVDTVIKVLEPDGNWFGLYYKDIAGLPTFKQMRFTDDNYIWINSSRYIPGIVCIDTKGTIKNDKDDRIKFSGPVFTNQDGYSEEISDIFFYDFDLDGTMWIGTNKGIFILENPNDYINTDKPVFQRIKIPRNDGTSQADYLLNGVLTTSIYIDQGNRKWIGTLNNGVFFLSEDGKEELEHFTSENSPLPSNYILSITENGTDGSVFFCTDKGTVEYGGTARDPENSLYESNITVYPNPVLPEHDDMVTVTGLSENSIVRFTSVSGNLLHIGKSYGGSYSWNLHDSQGNSVSSGIYYAIITDNAGNRSESISFTVVR